MIPETEMETNPTPKLRRHPGAPRFTVRVDKKTIEASTQRDSSHCMIAEAIRKAHPEAKQISVDLQTVRFSNHKRKLRFIYLTPMIAQRAIVHFDDGKKPEPFQFDLRGAHVIRIHTLSEEQREKKREYDAKRWRRVYKKRYAAKEPGKDRKLVTRHGKQNRALPEVYGGKAPPLSRGKNDTGIPFTRRRAYGLRALTL